MLATIIDWCNKYSGFTDFLVIITEFIGLTFVVITLKKDKKVKQAEFIQDYNFHFISSDSLVEMERKLENCYQIYKQHIQSADLWRLQNEDYEHIWNLMTKMIGFGPVSSTVEPVTQEYQKLVNYLVYLESLASLVLTGQVELKDIDDTFGYRYFIAMNNPVVQKYELLEEAEYYCGCIRVYKKWQKYRKKNRKEIPMQWFALTNNNPDRNNGILNPVYCSLGGQKLCQKYQDVIRRRRPVCRNPQKGT